MRKIRMTIGTVALIAELFETPTADAIHDSLPFESTAQTWGEEVYFATPVDVPQERFSVDRNHLTGIILRRG